MHVQIRRDDQDPKPSPLDLPPGEHGLEKDGTLRQGAPDGAPFRLRIDDGRAFLISKDSYEVDGVLFPPRVPRALLPGELATLSPGITLERPREAPSNGTRSVLRELFGGAEVASGKAARLWCLTGLDAGRAFSLIDGENVLGRGVEASIRLRERTVSKRHATLQLVDGEATLAEERGPNGVFVNGKKLTGKSLLRNGDVLELGRLLLRYEGPAEESAPPTPPEPEPAPAELGPPEEPSELDGHEDEPTVKVSRWWSGDWALLTGAAGIAAGGVLLSLFFAP